MVNSTAQTVVPPVLSACSSEGLLCGTAGGRLPTAEGLWRDVVGGMCPVFGVV